MLTPKPIVDKLNEQIANEFHAAHNYMAMACRFDALGLKVLSEWFFRQGEEERDHGKRILRYLLDVGADVHLNAISEPTGNLSDPVSIVQSALNQEEQVTKQIHDLVAMAEEHKDFATRSFLAWFVDEQVEEVATMTELLQMLKLAGDHHLLQVEARVARMMETPQAKP
ncbi:MAG: ferritin [Phycisphaerales bacterium]|nr:ferritin [Phycisphaerales bacterium]